MVNSYDIQYKQILHRILTEGIDCDDRTGVGTRKIFDAAINVDLRHDVEGEHLLPALTLRKIFHRVAFEEWLWMMSGSTNANLLKEKNVHIWDGNSSREYLDSIGMSHLQEGYLGNSYGHQFRNFNGHYDQLNEVIKGIKDDPNGRRHYISLWNPSDLDKTALPSCHLAYNFMVTGEHLNLKVIIRSNDWVLGQPTNAMFSTFFLTFVADLLGYKVGNLSMSITDAHIYQNHLEAAQEMLDRDPMAMSTFKWKTPQSGSVFDIDASLASMRWDDVNVTYQSHPAIAREKLQMAA